MLNQEPVEKKTHLENRQKIITSFNKANREFKLNLIAMQFFLPSKKTIKNTDGDIELSGDDKLCLIKLTSDRKSNQDEEDKDAYCE
jgi:hypothetical protein